MTTQTSNKPGFFVDADGSPVAVFSAITRVLPLSVQNKIAHLRDEHDRLQWLVGDLFNEIYGLVRSNRVDATRSDVANYVLHVLGLEGDRGFSSVLTDAATAGFYPSEIRARYSVLAFSHFRFAASFGGDAVAVLDEAMKFFDQYSRPPSVRWLKKQYEFQTTQRAASSVEPGAAMTPEASAATMGSFGRGPDFQVSPPAQPIDRVRFYVDGLRGTVTRLPGVRGDLVARIIALCDEALEGF